MTIAGDSRSNPLQPIAEELLREASLGPRLDAFMCAAARSLLRLDGVDRLELWLDDSGRRLGARAERARLAEGGEVELVTASLHERAMSDEILGSTERDEAAGESGESGFTTRLPFSVEDRPAGVLHLVGRAGARLDALSRERLELSARVVGVAFASRRAHAALAERVKELGCIYRIAHIASDPALDLAQMLQGVVELLPEAWQYPEVATARIVLDDRRFVTVGFREGSARLSADVRCGGTTRGVVEVFYVCDGPGAPASDDARLFLAEERHLLDAVAKELSFIVERQEAERDRRRLRETVRQHERLATIGQLAAGVAHELNEPLASILGFAQLAAKSSPLPESTERDLARIESACIYARDIIRDLLSYARQRPLSDEPIVVVDMLEAAIELVAERAQRAGVQIDSRFPEPPPRLLADKRQLQQVAVNLLINAIQASTSKGTVVVGLDAQPTGLSFYVEDDGEGIPDDLREQVFLPFFTTKDVGAGTGLGLAVAQGIVVAHGGRIDISSGATGGSRFTVVLPPWRSEMTASG